MGPPVGVVQDGVSVRGNDERTPARADCWCSGSAGGRALDAHRPCADSRPPALVRARNWSPPVAARLKTRAVDLSHLERIHIDTIHAADIDGRHFGARLRVRPERE
jgi:hypothetical protein